MGVDSATSEAVRQGKQAPKKPDLDAINKSLITRAEAVSQHLATALGQSAQRQMIRLSGGGLSATEVADQTAGFLRNLSTAYLEAQSNGALTSAMNTGRLATMRRNTPKACYSSELLDEATCEECVAIDGTPYETIDAASEDYPTGGFAGCLGMERCRGTVVAVYEETP